MNAMRLRGRVVNGRVEIEDDLPLPEGASVEVIIGEDYDLTEEEEEDLWQAHRSIERGEGIPAEVILRKLRGESED
jgi:hypothetical protein